MSLRDRLCCCVRTIGLNFGVNARDALKLILVPMVPRRQPIPFLYCKGSQRRWLEGVLFFALPGLNLIYHLARNRALLQRCKKEDSNSPHDFPGMRVNNGWREWDNLDALFESMGPNPLVMSEDLGPQVARGYQHSSNIATSFDWTTVFYCLSLFYPYVKAGLSFWHFTCIVQKFAALICAGEQTWE